MISMALLSVVSLHDFIFDGNEETAWKCGSARGGLEEKRLPCARTCGEPLFDSVRTWIGGNARGRRGSPVGRCLTKSF
jgi:hypothetical protein